MDSYRLTPDGRGGFAVQIRYRNGTVEYRTFRTETEALIWVEGQNKLPDEAISLRREFG